MGSDRSPHHLTRARASDFLAERSLLCISYSPWKGPEKEILHGLAYRNKTSRSCRGTDLEGKGGGNKSEEGDDETGRATSLGGAFKAIPLPSPPKNFGHGVKEGFFSNHRAHPIEEGAGGEGGAICLGENTGEPRLDAVLPRE